MAGDRCAPPKSQGVKSHYRRKGQKRRGRALTPRKGSSSVWVVKNDRTGRVLSRHRSLMAAGNAMKRANLRSFRAGRGRPYNVERQ